MKKLIQCLSFSSLLISVSVFANPAITLYKSPTCGCCKAWAEIMQDKGYQVTVIHQPQWHEVKQQHGLPAQLQSCHSAIIDGYLIEGHVPERDIARLLKERPKNIKGLSAPGMPQHSPGMAAPGESYRGFDVVSFDEAGKISLYQSY